ncbi:MAG: 3-dehydroquinate synthase [Magnetococcales bacterium]|nr:3-dehydroquinate synthase [Magnetococcales bacterium]
MNRHRALRVELGARSYDIVIGPGGLAGLGGALAPLLKGRRAAIVTNETVAPLYLPTVTDALERAGFQTLPVILPDGEVYKEWSVLQRIFDALIAHRFERSSVIVALGGGVIGDMAGFAAACFLRGTPFVQVPTTLLSQVDSSVGGKTGINHPLGKNLIGAFYQPRLVVIDTDALSTLPRRELLAGLAEGIKYGVIRDEPLFARLEEKVHDLLALEPEILSEVIHACCRIKAEVVAGDEREESGARALLNFGHTFGHAVESVAGYGNVLHGEAVAMGMMAAAELSVRLGICAAGEAERLRRLLTASGFDLRLPKGSVEDYWEAMTRDKKVEGGEIRFVLMTRIGHAEVRGGVARGLVEEVIREGISAN